MSFTSGGLNTEKWICGPGVEDSISNNHNELHTQFSTYILSISFIFLCIHTYIYHTHTHTLKRKSNHALRRLFVKDNAPNIIYKLSRVLKQVPDIRPAKVVKKFQCQIILSINVAQFLPFSPWYSHDEIIAGRDISRSRGMLQLRDSTFVAAKTGHCQIPRFRQLYIHMGNQEVLSPYGIEGAGQW